MAQYTENVQSAASLASTLPSLSNSPGVASVPPSGLPPPALLFLWVNFPAGWTSDWPRVDSFWCGCPRVCSLCCGCPLGHACTHNGHPRTHTDYSVHSARLHTASWGVCCTLSHSLLPKMKNSLKIYIYIHTYLCLSSVLYIYYLSTSSIHMSTVSRK